MEKLPANFDTEPFMGEEDMNVVVNCPLCGSHYDPTQTEVIEENDKAALFHIDCAKCGSSILACLVAGPFGVASMGLVTDLSRDDAKKLKSAKTVNHDDIIEIHQYLEKLQYKGGSAAPSFD